MTSGRVTSRDGTSIGYLTIGHGSGVVILHGSMESARSHTLLAEQLADEFTVYLPDRRGRGMSGPHRGDHSIRTEVGGPRGRPGLDRSRRWPSASAPAGWSSWRPRAHCLTFVRSRSMSRPWSWTGPSTPTGWSRFDREMADGNVAAAMITSMNGLELGPPVVQDHPEAAAGRHDRGRDETRRHDGNRGRRHDAPAGADPALRGRVVGGVGRRCRRVPERRGRRAPARRHEGAAVSQGWA